MNQSGRSRLELAVTSLPGIVGIGLGLVYTIGAVQIAGQARAAGHSALAVLPLFPFEAVLGRGVAFGLPFLGFIVIILMIAALVPVMSAWETNSTVGGKVVSGVRRNTSERVILSAACTAVVLVGVFFAVFAFAYLLMIAAICVVYIRLEHLGWDVAGRAVMSGIAGLLTIAVVGSYLAARPYPECVATLNDGKRLSGDLIAQSNDSLYIGRERELIAVPMKSVQKVRMGDIPGNLPEPLVSIFF